MFYFIFAFAGILVTCSQIAYTSSNNLSPILGILLGLAIALLLEIVCVLWAPQKWVSIQYELAQLNYDDNPSSKICYFGINKSKPFNYYFYPVKHYEVTRYEIKDSKNVTVIDDDHHNGQVIRFEKRYKHAVFNWLFIRKLLELKYEILIPTGSIHCDFTYE